MTPSELQAFARLARECGVDADETSYQPDAADADEPVLTEAQVTRRMLPPDRHNALRLNFLSAGACDYFLPAIVRQSAMDNSDPVKDAKAIREFLAEITALPECTLSANDVVTTLAGLLVSMVGKLPVLKGQSATPILLSAGIAPPIRSALLTQLKFHALDAEVMDFDTDSGCVSASLLDRYRQRDIPVCVFAWPNFFAELEPLQMLREWARDEKVRLVGLVNPLLLSYLRSPVEVLGGGIDFLVGDCQSLGLPVNRTGNAPSFIAGQDEIPAIDGGQLAVQDLAIINAYIAAQGVEGMRQGVYQGRQRLQQLLTGLQDIPAISIAFAGRSVNECVIRLNGVDVARALKILAGHNMLCGHPLDADYPQLQDSILIHCNDRHESEDVEKLLAKLKTVVKNLGSAPCPVKPRF